MSAVTSEPLVAPNRIAIIGIGLLGGSLGQALRGRWPTSTVIGTSRTAATRDAAVRHGCVDQAVADAEQACAGADWVFFCTPVDRIAGLARALSRYTADTAILTDVGSTKAALVESIEQDAFTADRFVGAHPIAGGERTGPQHARRDLFNDRTVIVTPTERTDLQRVGKVETLWRELGANVHRMSPALHDHYLAGISHAAHFAACAVAADLDPEARPFIGSGWRDITRVAAGDPTMWAEIAMANRGPIVQRLTAMREALTAYLEAIDTGDRAALLRLLEFAQQQRKQGVPPEDRDAAP